MSKKPPQMPGQGGSYVRDAKGVLSQSQAPQSQAPEPATPIQKPPAAAKPATGKKEA